MMRWSLLGILLIVASSNITGFHSRSWIHDRRFIKAVARPSSYVSASSVTEVGEASESVESAIKLGKSVAIFYPEEFNISASNPFGEAVTSVSGAASELKHLVKDRREELRGSDFLKCRIEYLVKVLKKSYVPSFTVEFMNLAMSGEWDHGYSNVLLRRADESLTCKITQKIIPANSKMVEGGASEARLGEINHANTGQIVNQVAWRVIDTKDQLNHGDLFVHSNYTIGSNGALSLDLGEHVVHAVKLTVEPMDLVMAIQRSIPFQFFDPSDSMAKNVYIDPELRISEMSGPIFQGVYDIFVRSDETDSVESVAEEKQESGPKTGLGFGKAKLRPRGK